MSFTAPGRDMAEEDRIVLTSVGVDIGSSTSHLLFSRLELERQDGRYVTVSRQVLYHAAGLARSQVDTGALILTGVALLRENARSIADLFASEAGRFVAVSAGDNLEA